MHETTTAYYTEAGTIDVFCSRPHGYADALRAAADAIDTQFRDASINEIVVNIFSDHMVGVLVRIEED
jgi:hypothetical protein